MTTRGSRGFLLGFVWPGRIITPISSTGSCGIRHHKSGTASNTKGEAKSEDLDLEVGDMLETLRRCVEMLLRRIKGGIRVARPGMFEQAPHPTTGSGLVWKHGTSITVSPNLWFSCHVSWCIIIFIIELWQYFLNICLGFPAIFSFQAIHACVSKDLWGACWDEFQGAQSGDVFGLCRNGDTAHQADAWLGWCFQWKGMIWRI